jgi:hypothetical protein
MKPFRVRCAPILATAYLICAVSTIQSASSTPQFARETRLPCRACHLHGSLLNVFGQRYFSNGFRIGKRKPERDTWPLWATLGVQTTLGRDFTAPINYAPTEIASYGYLEEAKLLYHLAYQPTKEQTDIYLLSPVTQSLTVQIGEIGLLGQYITKLDVSPTRQANLQPIGFDDRGLFAPGANAFAVRVVGSLSGPSAMPYADGWKVAATVPFSNEASPAWQPEFDETPTGLFAELFHRTGLTSYGINAFAGRNGRRFYGAVGQHQYRQIYFEGGLSYAEANGRPTRLASLSGTYIPTYHQAYGFRIDDQDGTIGYVPTLSWMIGSETKVVRLVAETRITSGVSPTTTLSAQFKF